MATTRAMALLNAFPKPAIAIAKHSFLGANGLLLDERQMTLLSHEGWTQRASAEGHEGTLAFREKRHPSWYRAPSA